MSKQSDWDVRVTHATNGWLTVLVAHSAGQINGHTLYMSKQYDWDVCVTHATNGWLTVLHTTTASASDNSGGGGGGGLGGVSDDAAQAPGPSPGWGGAS